MATGHQPHDGVGDGVVILVRNYAVKLEGERPAGLMGRADRRLRVAIFEEFDEFLHGDHSRPLTRVSVTCASENSRAMAAARSPKRAGSMVVGRGLAVAVSGADAARWQWGMGSLGRYAEAQVLRELVKAAERAETEADRLAVVRAGIQVLEGHAAVLELAVGQDA